MYKMMIGEEPFYFPNYKEAEFFYKFLHQQNRLPKKFLPIQLPEKCILETIESAIAKFEHVYDIALKEENEKPILCNECDGKGKILKHRRWFISVSDCKHCHGKGIRLIK